MPLVDKTSKQQTRTTHHNSGFWAGNAEFERRILLPVPKHKRESMQEPVVGVAKGGKGLRIGVAIQTAIERAASFDKSLPGIEVVWVGFL
jgi:hypothetical protein